MKDHWWNSDLVFVLAAVIFLLSWPASGWVVHLSEKALLALPFLMWKGEVSLGTTLRIIGALLTLLRTWRQTEAREHGEE